VDGFDEFQVGALAALAAIFGGKAASLLRRGIQPITLASGKMGAARAFELATVPAFALFAAAVLACALGAPRVAGPLVAEPWPAAARWAGAALASAAVATFTLALTAFGTSWRVGIDARAPGKLVTTGIFGLTRNPIFVGIDLYVLGTFLLTGRAAFLAFAAAAAVAVHFQIREEERFLAGHYGAAYEAYRARVPRYLGF
jgi:protein-S-isoprenylcysteine O-methyltransferase Ste14